MFPVANDYGDVIAFSGRVLDPESKLAKYMNSPETLIFNKSKTFFGLDRAKRPVLKARSAIVCEGQLDLITCSSSGVENVVAPLGTAFTADHARLLARHADEVVLCFDADSAGFKAAERAFKELAAAKLEVRVATMPEGEDPDSLIRSQGVQAFGTIIESARPFLEHVVARGMEQIGGGLRERAKLAESISPFIALVPDKIAQDSAINDLAVRLGVSADEVRKQVRREADSQSRQARYRKGKEDASANEEPAPTASIADRSVFALLQLALTDSAVRESLRAPEAQAILSCSSETPLLVKAIQANIDSDSPETFDRFLAALEPSEETTVRLAMASRPPDTGDQGASPYLNDIERTGLQLRLESLKASALKSPLDRATFDEIAQITARLREMGTGMWSLTSRQLSW